MLDLETLDTSPTALILAIGAVKFGRTELGDVFYMAIDIQSCLDKDLTISGSTLTWWLEQSLEAQAEAFKGTIQLPEALRHFAEFLEDSDIKVWGNGAAFDNVILANAYRACGIPVPWKFWNDRCYRTLKNERPEVPLERVGTHHNALDDAISQAQHLIRIWK